MSGLDERAAIVAGKLSEAQRRALCRVVDLPADRRLPICALNRKTYDALERRGLLKHDIIGMVSCAVAWPLGLAVRDHLANPTPCVTKE